LPSAGGNPRTVPKRGATDRRYGGARYRLFQSAPGWLEDEHFKEFSDVRFFTKVLKTE
jgi:hypothetical protein